MIEPHSKLGLRMQLGLNSPHRSLSDNVPLRLAGGLKALLLSNQAPELAPIYQAGGVADRYLPELVHSVLNQHDIFLADFLTLPSQANAVIRTAGLIAAAHWLNPRQRKI